MCLRLDFLLTGCLLSPLQDSLSRSAVLLGGREAGPHASSSSSSSSSSPLAPPLRASTWPPIRKHLIPAAPPRPPQTPRDLKSSS